MYVLSVQQHQISITLCFASSFPARSVSRQDSLHSSRGTKGSSSQCCRDGRKLSVSREPTDHVHSRNWNTTQDSTKAAEHGQHCSWGMNGETLTWTKLPASTADGRHKQSSFPGRETVGNLLQCSAIHCIHKQTGTRDKEWSKSLLRIWATR